MKIKWLEFYVCAVVSVLCCFVPSNVQVKSQTKHWSILRAVCCGVLGIHKEMSLMNSSESWDFLLFGIPL